MRGLKRNPWLSGLGVLLAILVVTGGHARADVTTDQSGSIIIFPKVIADGTRDTLIQITNTSNMSAQAQCFYVNTAGFCSLTTTQGCSLDSDCPQPETCVRQCQPINFSIFLTAQQPTVWRVSTGRLVDTTVPACKLGEPCSCTVGDNAVGQRCPGFAPGTGAQNSFAVPPVVPGFQGELKCVQTADDFQTPVMQNSLKGEAVLETLADGQVSEYNALAVSARAGLNLNNDLLLDNTEYNACPQSLVLNHYVEDTADAFTQATVETELTLVPCTELLERDPSQGTRSRALFSVVDEFENTLTTSVTFDCMLSRRLGDISSQFRVATTGSLFAKTRITPPADKICLTGSRRGLTCSTDDENAATGCPARQLTEGVCTSATGQQSSTGCSSSAQCPSGFPTCVPGGVSLGCRPWTGLLGVAEEFHHLDGRPDGTAAVNLHMEGSRVAPGDIIVIAPNF